MPNAWDLVKEIAGLRKPAPINNAEEHRKLDAEMDRRIAAQSEPLKVAVAEMPKAVKAAAVSAATCGQLEARNSSIEAATTGSAVTCSGQAASRSQNYVGAGNSR